MAYRYSKGWYISKLKERGLTRHPVGLKKLELYKTFIIRNLYNELLQDETNKQGNKQG